ncbi:MAG TPA: M56 family metallopeptidase [Pseudonocardiaceae bacterium]|jgi:Zn-dependent protease with chaperone function|nr:M56 family metallopeptidase [Pseudonocardiaceae bacterium]
MILSVYFPLVLPAAAVPVVRWLCGRLHPMWASWLIIASGLVLCACATLALALLMFTALSMLSVFARLGHWSTAALRQMDAVDLPVDLTATVLLLAFGAMAAIVTVSRVRALSLAHRTARRCRDGGQLTVVVDDRPLAHALPGRPGRIVVSTSMLALLAPAERRALLAHERAHLARKHHLFVATVDVLAAANPLLRPLVSAIRYTTERWADEVAAGQVGDRAVVARAVGKAALAGNVRPGGNPMALAVTGGPVPRRVAALLSAPPVLRLRSVLLSPVGVFTVVVFALVAGSVMFSVDAADDLHRVLALARH